MRTSSQNARLYFGCNQYAELHTSADLPAADLAIIFCSGYSILGFEEPIQVALRELLDQFGYGWLQFSYLERNVDSITRDLSITTGFAALRFVHQHLRSVLRPSARIGVFGISFGGNIAAELAMVAPLDPVLLVNPVLDYPRFRRQQLGGHEYDRWRAEGRTDIDYSSGRFPTYGRFIEEAEGQRLLYRLEASDVEALIWQAEKDEFVGTADSKYLAARTRGITTEVIADADHTFATPEAIDRFIDGVRVRLPRPELLKNALAVG